MVLSNSMIRSLFSFNVYGGILVKTADLAPSRCRAQQHLSNGVYYKRIDWIFTKKLRWLWTPPSSLKKNHFWVFENIYPFSGYLFWTNTTSRSSLYCKLSFKEFLVTINVVRPRNWGDCVFCEGVSSWSSASIFVAMKPTAPRSMELELVLMRMCCKVSLWFWSCLLWFGNLFYNSLSSAIHKYTSLWTNTHNTFIETYAI